MGERLKACFKELTPSTELNDQKKHTLTGYFSNNSKNVVLESRGQQFNIADSHIAGLF